MLHTAASHHACSSVSTGYALLEQAMILTAQELIQHAVAMYHHWLYLLHHAVSNHR